MISSNKIIKTKPSTIISKQLQLLSKQLVKILKLKLNISFKLLFQFQIYHELVFDGGLFDEEQVVLSLVYYILN